jgi:hypothetical protein
LSSDRSSCGLTLEKPEKDLLGNWSVVGHADIGDDWATVFFLSPDQWRESENRSSSFGEARKSETLIF